MHPGPALVLLFPLPSPPLPPPFMYPFLLLLPSPLPPATMYPTLRMLPHRRPPPPSPLLSLLPRLGPLSQQN